MFYLNKNAYYEAAKVQWNLFKTVGDDWTERSLLHGGEGSVLELLSKLEKDASIEALQLELDVRALLAGYIENHEENVYNGQRADELMAKGSLR